MSLGKQNKNYIKLQDSYWQKWRKYIILCLILIAYIHIGVSTLAQSSKEELVNHLKKAEHYHQSGNNNQARIELEAANKLNPQNAEILNSLGSIYLNLSESSSNKECQSDNLAAARKYFTSALSLNNEFAAAWNGMAGVYYLGAENTKAISCYKKALTLAPKRSYEVLTNLANTLRDSEQTDEAENYYKKAIEVNPLYAPAHNGYAELLYNKQKYLEALSEAVEAIKLKPDYATAYYHFGLIQSARGNYADAMKAYLLSLRYETNSRYAQDTHTLMGKLGLEDKTISAHDLERFQLSLCRGAALESKHNVEVKQPQQNAETIAGLASDLPDRFNDIHVLEINKKWERAGYDLSFLLKAHPDDPVILNEMGLIYLNQKKYSLSEHMFKRAWYISHESSPAISYNLGQVYLGMHNIADAQNYLKKAKKLAKDDTNISSLINNALAIACKQAGDLTESQKAYEEAIVDGGKQHPVFHYNLALLLEQMDKSKEAAHEFNLYLELSPHGINAKSAHEHLTSINKTFTEQ